MDLEKENQKTTYGFKVYGHFQYLGGIVYPVVFFPGASPSVWWGATNPYAYDESLACQSGT